MKFFQDVFGGADTYDVAVRCSRTFIQTFLAVLIGGGLLPVEVGAYHAALLAAISAVLAVIHGYVTPASTIPEKDWTDTVDDAMLGLDDDR